MIFFPARSVSVILPVAQALFLFMASGAQDARAATGDELISQGRDISGDDPVSWTEPPTEPLIGAPPKRTRTIAALMLDLGPGAPDKTRVTTGMESVRQMYIEESYGMQDVAVDVVGPWKLPVGKCLTVACCGPSSDRTGNGATVMSAISSLGKTYDHYFYMYGDEPSGSSCATWGDAGNPTTPAKYCNIQAKFQSGASVYGMEQELGHNLGMEHEHTMTCSGGAIFPENPSSCTLNEYGSRLSYMGGGQGHASAYHKVHQGWLSGCNVVKAAGAGSYALLPLELPCDGTQLLQIPAAKTRSAPKGQVSFFYAELRTPTGRDKANSPKPAVIIYAGPDFSSVKGYAAHTYLLTQLTAAGQSFSDPSGSPTLTVQSIGMTSATITITGGSGAATCLDGSAFTAPGPDASSCAAAPATMPGMGGSAGTGGMGAGNTGGSAGAGSGGRVGGSGGGSGRGGTAGSPSGSGGSGTGGTTAGGSGGISTGSGGSINSTGGATPIGSGGSVPVATGGASTPATGGSSGSGGSGQTGGAPGGGIAPDPTTAGGCACSATAERDTTSNAALVLLLALAASAPWLRRKRIRVRRHDDA